MNPPTKPEQQPQQQDDDSQEFLEEMVGFGVIKELVLHVVHGEDAGIGFTFEIPNVGTVEVGIVADGVSGSSGINIANVLTEQRSLESLIRIIKSKVENLSDPQGFLYTNDFWNEVISTWLRGISLDPSKSYKSTTLCLCVRIKDFIFVYNVGDSAAFIVRSDGVAYALSYPQSQFGYNVWSILQPRVQVEVKERGGLKMIDEVIATLLHMLPYSVPQNLSNVLMLRNQQYKIKLVNYLKNLFEVIYEHVVGEEYFNGVKNDWHRSQIYNQIQLTVAEVVANFMSNPNQGSFSAIVSSIRAARSVSSGSDSAGGLELPSYTESKFVLSPELGRYSVVLLTDGVTENLARQISTQPEDEDMKAVIKKFVVDEFMGSLGKLLIGFNIIQEHMSVQGQGPNKSDDATVVVLYR